MRQFIKLSRIFLLSILFVGISVPGYADLYEPVPHCYQPSKPLWFASSDYKKRYDNDVNEYHTCMKKFIKKQEAAANKHTQAAQNAIAIWNDFVNNK